MLTDFGSNNGEILGWDGLNHDPERVMIVKNAVKLRFKALLAGDLVFDNIKVFIKQEAHDLKKIAEGRFRLISAVSLIDTMIDRILFGWLGRKVLHTVGNSPCLVGWSPVRGGWRQFSDRFRGKAVVCLDKSAWDWTVDGYMVDLWLDVLEHLAVDHAPWWLDMVKSRFKILFEIAKFQFDDGTVVQQQTKGIMKSGCFLTIILNSLSQSLLHYISNMRCGKEPSLKQPYTIGDDTVQESFPWLLEYAQHMEDLGVSLKGVKIRKYVEFAGFAYDGKTCFPAYWKKHLFNMAHTSSLPELLKCYQYLWVHEPVMYKFVTFVADRVDPPVRIPRLLALEIMDTC